MHTINALTVRQKKDNKLIKAVGFDCETDIILLELKRADIDFLSFEELDKKGFSYNTSTIYLETEIYHLIEEEYLNIVFAVEKVEIS